MFDLNVARSVYIHATIQVSEAPDKSEENYFS